MDERVQGAGESNFWGTPELKTTVIGPAKEISCHPAGSSGVSGSPDLTDTYTLTPPNPSYLFADN